MGHTVYGVAKKGTRLSDWFKGRRPLESFWNYLLKQVCSQPSRQRPDDSHNVLLVPRPREGARGDPGAPSQAPRRLTGRATREAPRGTPGRRGLAPRGRPQVGEADGRQLAEEAPGHGGGGGGGRGDRPPERDAGEAGTRPARGRCHLPGGGAPAEPGRMFYLF